MSQALMKPSAFAINIAGIFIFTTTIFDNYLCDIYYLKEKFGSTPPLESVRPFSSGYQKSGSGKTEAVQ